MRETVLAFDPLGSAGPLTVWIVVLSFVFLECAFVVGLFLPGDSLLIAAGVVLAAHHQELSAWLLSAAAVLVAVAGNQVGYLVGRYTGTRIKTRQGGRILTRANLDRAGRFLDRWGFWSIVVARWVPWIRTLAPTIAGAARMDNRKFVLANLVGGIVWVPTLLMIGYYGAGLLDEIPWVRHVAVIGAIAFFVIGTAYGLFRYVQEIRKPVDEDEPAPAADPGH
ncbi:DedA family protein [Pseudonocardia ailaonensis]|uniref:DedA family protein n=1 Tax=Pseudonocardia ailaonensis TaxID=367279 RepID=A0ABN2NP89_9PSEU